MTSAQIARRMLILMIARRAGGYAPHLKTRRRECELMAGEGLMRSNAYSTYRWWTITPAGKRWLTQQKKNGR